jgi:hypothetical protein
MIKVGDRIRWRGLIGHEGTVVQLGANGRWAWIEYDDGTEKDAYLVELELIK